MQAPRLAAWGLAAIVGSSVGCHARDATSPCGAQGTEVVSSVGRYCVYIVIEGGFECPPGLPFSTPSEGGMVCGDHASSTPDDLPPEVCAVTRWSRCGRTDGGVAPCRVAQSACTFGLLSATCGADAAEPTFACDPTDGRCAWFTSECIATGFEPTSCPASDVCCIDGYPYDATWREPVLSDTLVHDFLYSWGTAPWTDARDANVVVTVDPMVAAGPLTMACTGGPPGIGGPCDPAAMLRTISAADVSFAIAITDSRPNLGGWNLWIEAVGARARVCRAPFTDGVVFTCVGVPGPDCAVSGTLVLSRDVAAGTTSAHGQLDVSLASGTSIAATF